MLDEKKKVIDIPPRKGRKPSFKLSYESQLLIQYFQNKQPGDLVTYEELSKYLGEKVTGAHPAYQSARKVLPRDHGIVIETIRGVGAKVLEQEEIPQIASKTWRSIRKKVRFVQIRLSNVEYDSISKSAKEEFNLQMTLARFMDKLTRPNKINKLRTLVKQEESTLAARRTLETIINANS